MEKEGNFKKQKPLIKSWRATLIYLFFNHFRFQKSVDFYRLRYRQTNQSY